VRAGIWVRTRKIILALLRPMRLPFRDRLFGTIFLVAIFVPGIALIVGAIVIMNICWFQ